MNTIFNIYLKLSIIWYFGSVLSWVESFKWPVSITKSYLNGVNTFHRHHREAVLFQSQTTASVSATKGNKKGQRKGSPELQKVLEKYEPVVGIEVHCQLLTESKAYCGCSTKYNPNIPNTNVCPVCMGEPGSLPQPNQKVLEFAAKAAMALNCRISNIVKFDRKNYFYPDTPKNYQITQYDYPIGSEGFLDLPSGKRVGITRLHMEEDSAKMIHQGAESLAGSSHSLIDFNRAGVPLIEIVSEPDMRSPEEGADYGRELQKVLRFIGVSDGAMADGSLRLDVNISLRPKGSSKLNTKVEIKNINSFRFVADAIEFECVRQGALYEQGLTVSAETRLWDEREQGTKFMRSKEGAADYRYFPEPDIPPTSLAEETLLAWRSQIQELPAAKRQRYQTQFKLDAEMSRVLTDDLSIARYFDECVAANADPAEAAKWITGDMAGVMRATSEISSSGGTTTIDSCKLRPFGLADLIRSLTTGEITTRTAKDILPDLVFHYEGLPSALIQERGLGAIRDEGRIGDLAKKVMEENPDKVEQYRSGKTKLLGFFVGQTMAASQGRAAPDVLQSVVEKMLMI